MSRAIVAGLTAAAGVCAVMFAADQVGPVALPPTTTSTSTTSTTAVPQIVCHDATGHEYRTSTDQRCAP